MLNWVSIGLNKCQNNPWVLGKYTDGTTNNRLMTCRWKRFYHDIVPQLHSSTRPTDHGQAGIRNAQSVFLVQTKLAFFFDILCEFHKGAIFQLHCWWQQSTVPSSPDEQSRWDSSWKVHLLFCCEARQNRRQESFVDKRQEHATMDCRQYLENGGYCPLVWNRQEWVDKVPQNQKPLEVLEPHLRRNRHC